MKARRYTSSEAAWALLLFVLCACVMVACVGLLMTPASQAAEPCSDTGVVDALAMRNYRHYDTAENLIPDTSSAVWIEVGDPVPAEADMVLIDNGTARPFIVRAAAYRTLAKNEMATADLWVHATGRVCAFVPEIHEHVDAHRGEIRRDFYKWKVQGTPSGVTRTIPGSGWHRFDLWQQRSNGSTIMDVHCCGQDRNTGMSAFNAEVSWETP